MVDTKKIVDKIKGSEYEGANKAHNVVEGIYGHGASERAKKIVDKIKGA
jgi:hypothetical protein